MTPRASRHGDPQSRRGPESIYLDDIPRQQAQARLRDALVEAGLWRVLGVEEIPLDENAVGRVTAATIWARMSSPHYHAAAMDGFAIRSGVTAGAAPKAPKEIVVGLGTGAQDGDRAQYVDTGDPLPPWADAVVPIENIEPVGEDGKVATNPRSPVSFRIRAAITPWSHVRAMGEDLVATQLVIASGTTLRPVDLGAIAAAGHDRVMVARKPRVAVIPTGSELAPIGATPDPGTILEYNSIVLAAIVNGMGGICRRYPIVHDDVDSIADAVRRASGENDLVLLNAGSSAGAEDFSSDVIARLGRLLVHGVAVRPGHPVLLGLAAGDPAAGRPPTTIVGVPGYPVSAALTIEIFVAPLLDTWLGRNPAEPDTEVAEFTHKVTSPSGDEDYVRVILGRVRDRLVAAPLASGAGVITSLVKADGMVIIPPGTQGIEAGAPVPVRLLRSRPDLERTILCVGSHDVILDLLAVHLARRERRFVSMNVGSQGGLLALQRNRAHLAGCHLLDPESAEYNIPFIRRFLPDVRVKAIALVKRDQGLLVQRGNPKSLTQLTDLARPGVTYVNRQRGAGTRVLLDYHLDRLGISPDLIHGYNQEEYTHLAVAAAIASGRADCGLGIAAAAQALGLDFVALFQERYDLVMPAEHADDSLLYPLMEVLGSAEFREDVARLPGYDVSVMGRAILEDR